MEVKLDKTYPLDVDAARAWAVLRDVRTVAGCMPGATLTEQVDDAHYRGSVKVKVGPASAAFATYYGNYHGTYEPPFCHVQARGLFETVR